MVPETLIHVALLLLSEPGAAPPVASPAPATPPAAAPAPSAAATPAAATAAPSPAAAVAPEAAPSPDVVASPSEASAPAEASTREGSEVADDPAEPDAKAESEAEAEPTDDPPKTVADAGYKFVGFDIGVIPAWSINGKYRDQKVRNNVSLGVLWNRAAVVEGMTMSMGVTVVDERADGLSAALVGNVNHGDVSGLQAAVGFNTAERVRGIQASHILNRAKTVEGAQFAMVNVAGKVRGAQFGLVNVADEADASIALIPYTRQGGVHPEVFTSDTALINVGLRLPAKYTYMFASVGMHPLGARRDGQTTVNGGRGQAWEAGMGYGGHLPLAKGFSLDLDLSSYVVTDSLRWEGTVAGLAKARLLVSWQIAKRFSLWGGPTVNALVNDVSAEFDRPGYQWIAGRFEDDEVEVRVWPGFVAGVRF